MHKIINKLFAALLIEDVDLGQEIGLILLALVGFEVVFPVFVSGFAFGLVGFHLVVLSHVLT